MRSAATQPTTCKPLGRCRISDRGVAPPGVPERRDSGPRRKLNLYSKRNHKAYGDGKKCRCRGWPQFRGLASSRISSSRSYCSSRAIDNKDPGKAEYITLYRGGGAQQKRYF